MKTRYKFPKNKSKNSRKGINPLLEVRVYSPCQNQCAFAHFSYANSPRRPRAKKKETIHAFGLSYTWYSCANPQNNFRIFILDHTHGNPLIFLIAHWSIVMDNSSNFIRLSYIFIAYYFLLCQYDGVTVPDWFLSLIHVTPPQNCHF